MNMISTGAFLNEMDASNKQPTVAEKFAAVWEKKNTKAARAGGVSLMALSLAACGSSSTTTTSTDTSTSTDTTTTTPTNQAFDLTAGFDTFTGGAGDDTFTSSKDGNFSIDDTLDGGDGTDTLYLRAESTSVGTASTTNIEVVDVRATADYTLSMTNMQTVTTVANNASAVNMTFSGAAASTGLKVVGVSTASKTTSLDFKAKAIDGTADTVELEIGNVTAAHAISLNDASTGTIETLNINSSAKNTALVTLEDDAVAPTTINITGAGDLEITATNGMTGKTIDASAATGKVDITFGTLTTARTITGGEGDDTFTEDVAGDLVNKTTIVGGDGTDTLELKAASGTILANTASTGNVENVSGIETLKLASQLTGATTIDMSKITGLKDLTFTDINDGSNAVTVTNLLDGAKITMGDATADTLTNAFTFSFATNSSANNITLAVTDISTPDITTGDGKADELIIEAKGTNELNVASAAVKTITASGTGTLDLDDGGTTLNAATTTVDASAVEGAVVVAASATSTTITTGKGGDTITGGGAADVLSAGAGTDTINATKGNDDIDGGDGTDTYKITNADNGGLIEDGDRTDNYINLATGKAVFTDAAGVTHTQTLTGIENVNLDAQNDKAVDIAIVGDANANDIVGGGGDDKITGGAGSDVFTLGAGVDIVTDLEVGTSGDDIKLDLSDIEGAALTDLIKIDGAASVADSDTVVLSTVTGVFDADALTSDTTIVVIDGTIASTDALETALEASGSFELTLDGAVSDGDAFLVLYDNGTNSYLATVELNDLSGGAHFSANDTAATGDLAAINIVTFEGVSDCTTITAAMFTDIV